MKSFILVLSILLYSPIVLCQEEEQSNTETEQQESETTEEKIETDFVLIETLKISDSIYHFRIKSDGTSFFMKICSSDQCEDADAVEYLKGMNPDTFVYAVMTSIKNAYSQTMELEDLETEGSDIAIKGILNKVKEFDEKEVRKELSEAQNIFRTIDNAKDNYSGVLVLNVNKEIPYEITTHILKEEKLKKQLAEELENLNNELAEADKKILENLSEESALYQYLNVKVRDGKAAFIADEQIKNTFSNEAALYYKIASESNQYNRYCNSDYKIKTSKGKGVLKVTHATVQFFNNKAATIKVRAKLTEADQTFDLVFLNVNFSVPTRYFNIYGSTVSALFSEKNSSGRRNTITIDYNDIFDFLNYKNSYSYSVANGKHELKKGDSNNPDTHVKKIPERRFFDFFSGIIYSDLMGFNTESSNSLVNAQARVLLPLNLRNKGKYSVLRQLTAVTNVALQSSFDDENRFINIKDSEKFNHFDLLRKNNLFGKLSLEIFTHEAKGFFTNFGVGYSAGFYRTGFRLTQTENVEPDSTITRQLLSIGHGPYINFEIRPQSNFGADVTFSLEDLNYAGEATVGGRAFKEDIISNTQKDKFILPYNLINLEANFYWLTNPQTSVGGIYAKLGAYFHTDTNSVFPQFMVGYASNLTSFVDKFSSSTPDAKPEPIEED